MVTFPNCKINLGLHIISKRPDNYHELETVFYPLPFTDVLEVVSKEPGDESPGPKVGSREPEAASSIYDEEGLQFMLSGLNPEGEPANNLCIKAWHLLKRDYPQLPAIQLYLHKAIPAGAGLGGGSADGAFLLKLLNEKFHLQIPEEQLLAYALQLGSDCPFFIKNTPCLATGRGELLEPVHLNLSNYSFVLVHPGIHIPTVTAFAQLTPAPPVKPLTEIIKQPVNTWKDELKNDFEVPAGNQYPELKSIKEKLYAAGAVYASMSGSGSSFYGIFNKGVINTELFSSYNFHILNT